MASDEVKLSDAERAAIKRAGNKLAAQARVLQKTAEAPKPTSPLSEAVQQLGTALKAVRETRVDDRVAELREAKSTRRRSSR